MLSISFEVDNTKAARYYETEVEANSTVYDAMKKGMKGHFTEKMEEVNGEQVVIVDSINSQKDGSAIGEEAYHWFCYVDGVKLVSSVNSTVLHEAEPGEQITILWKF